MDRDEEMAAAGARFETEVRAAMAERDIPSLAELERQTGIRRRTWEDWFGGIHAPRPGTLSRAARALRRSPEYLLERYDGVPSPRRTAPKTNGTIEVYLSRIADALDRLTETGLDHAEREEGEARGRAAERALRRDADTGSRARRRAPRDSLG